MKVERFEEYYDAFALDMQVDSCEESTRLARLLSQCKTDGIKVHALFSKAGNTTLCITIPKAKEKRGYESYLVELNH